MSSCKKNSTECTVQPGYINLACQISLIIFVFFTDSIRLKNIQTSDFFYFLINPAQNVNIKAFISYIFFINI